MVVGVGNLPLSADSQMIPRFARFHLGRDS
jgi:hypothetical protein